MQYVTSVLCLMLKKYYLGRLKNIRKRGEMNYINSLKEKKRNKVTVKVYYHFLITVYIDFFLHHSCYKVLTRFMLLQKSFSVSL